MLKAGTKRRRNKKQVEKDRETAQKIQKLGLQALEAEARQPKAPNEEGQSALKKDAGK